MLVVGFWKGSFGDYDRVRLDIKTMVDGDFAATSCMVAFAALLGKVDLVSMFILTTLQVVFYGLNRSIAFQSFEAADVGGTITVFTFGAYFGLAASYFFQRKEAAADAAKKHGGNYHSNLVAMFGTIFLYLYWPSFNAALAPDMNKQRIVVNTALCISASLISAGALCRLYYGKLQMDVILHATLAGGVIIGASADFIMGGGGAIVIGCLAGLLSTWGYCTLAPRLQSWFGLHDTCGVHSMIAMPGFCGGIISGVCATFADRYLIGGEVITNIYPMIGPERDFKTQGSFQIAALAVTIGIAICGGIFSAFFAEKIGNKVKDLFDDKEHWHNCVEDAPEPEGPVDHEPVKGSYWSKVEGEDNMKIQ